MKCVVIGSNGGIGAALAEALERRAGPVIRVARGTSLALDLLDEDSVAASAAAIGSGLDLVVDATGFLHDARYVPEKRLGEINPAHLAYSFAVNAIGPALLLKHFSPLLAQNRRAVFATLSARVGSITDNHLGGWYSYRASKAALNQLVRTAAIELARTRKRAICVALHPGTVQTGLSNPFSKAGLEVQTPLQAAENLVAVIDALTPQQTGQFLDHRGQKIEF